MRESSLNVASIINNANPKRYSKNQRALRDGLRPRECAVVMSVPGWKEDAKSIGASGPQVDH